MFGIANAHQWHAKNHGIFDSSSSDARVADAVKLKGWVESGNYTNSAAVQQPFGGFSNSGS